MICLVNGCHTTLTQWFDDLILPDGLTRLHKSPHAMPIYPIIR
jgi:hypothetical protein